MTAAYEQSGAVIIASRRSHCARQRESELIKKKTPFNWFDNRRVHLWLREARESLEHVAKNNFDLLLKQSELIWVKGGDEEMI